VRPRKKFCDGRETSYGSRASIMTALAASCFLVSALRAGDPTLGEKTSDDAISSAPDKEDSAPDNGLDPTILHSRISLTNEFKDQELGAAKDTATLNLSYAFGDAKRREWTVQLDLPAVYYDAGRTSGVSSGGGLGDIECRIGHVLQSEGVFRYAIGLEAEFDTAGGPPLGDGVFRLSPVVALVFQPCRAFTFQSFLQYNQSLITETGVSEVQELHVKPAVNWTLPDNWYAYSEFEETWGLHAHGGFSSTAKFEVGRGFGSRGEWVLSARCEIPLASSQDDYTVTVACSYTFK
jgi:hypothetical protein